jgi:hypothetical protein
MSKKPYLDCFFQSDADSSLLCSALLWSGLVWCMAGGAGACRLLSCASSKQRRELATHSAGHAGQGR